MTEEEVIKKIIREQDLVSIYALRGGYINTAIGILEQYSKEPKIKHSDLSKFIVERKEILDNFSTPNLLNILFKMDREKSPELVSLIMDRLEHENFFIDNIDYSFMMTPYYSVNKIFHDLGKDNVEKIKQEIVGRLSKFKGTNLEKVAKGICYLEDAANFLKYAEDGQTFSQEKIDFIEQMLEKDENALRHVNFGVFQNDIWNIGQDFVEYIAKFPFLSQELIVLQQHNKGLFEILSKKIRKN